MAERRLHWRIAYSLEEFYYVVASSNVPPNPLVLSWANLRGGYTAQNGMASILSKSPKAKVEGLIPHLFIPHGNALIAMKSMIDLLDKINGRHHLNSIARL